MLIRLSAMATIVMLPAAVAGATPPLEEVVVTATRRPLPALETPLSLSAVSQDALQLLGATHHEEALNRLPGVMIQRGSGQESLTAIRSPVLTGAGSCGAFLFLENGVPIRPVGFCNVNELFEVNTEQAAAIEVLRGPGTALYGSNAVHGVVNVLQPAPADRPELGLAFDAGPANYVRTKVAGSHTAGDWDYGLAGLYTHDGGWRDHSGYDEAKLNAAAMGRWGGTTTRIDLAATTLDQQTAGFIVGKDAYQSDELSRQNLNPEAYRKARSVRATALLERQGPAGARLELRPFLRSSRMEFLQHFLLGKPLERNGQESLGMLSSLAWDDGDDWSAVAGLDLEAARSFLVEDQDGPATGAPPAAISIRPPGLHYDYEVRSLVAALYVQGERRLGARWRATAGLRAETVNYDYDNRMLAGNTDENGVPCMPAGCLYSRPADRTDAFFNVAPKLGLSLRLGEGLLAYANASLGFRPPEMTELYRLQRGQRVADLDSERIDALELGIKGSWPSLDVALAAFDMRKHRRRRPHHPPRPRVPAALAAARRSWPVAGGNVRAASLRLLTCCRGRRADQAWQRRRHCAARAVPSRHRLAAGRELDVRGRVARGRRLLARCVECAPLPGTRAAQPARPLADRTRLERDAASQQCARSKLRRPRRLRLRHVSLFPWSRPGAVRGDRLAARVTRDAQGGSRR